MFGKHSLEHINKRNVKFDKNFFDDFKDFFFKILDRLYTKDERTVIVLKCFEKNNYDELVKNTGMSIYTICNILINLKKKDRFEIDLLQLLLTGKLNLPKRELLEKAKDINEEFISMYYPKVKDYLNDDVIPTIIELAIIS